MWLCCPPLRRLMMKLRTASPLKLFILLLMWIPIIILYRLSADYFYSEPGYAIQARLSRDPVYSLKTASKHGNSTGASRTFRLQNGVLRKTSIKTGSLPEDIGHAMPDDENVAKEVVDVWAENGKHIPLAGIDENAAREEHSGELEVFIKKKEAKLGEENNDKAEFVNDVEEQDESFHQLPEHQKELTVNEYDSYNNWRNFSDKEIGKLSVMGRRLFLNENIGTEQNKIFKIHVWKYMKHIQRRMLRRFTSNAINPFEGCSVNNCLITSADDQVTQADAVIFHLQRITGPPSDVPRRPHQVWVWLSDESPHNVFMVSKDRTLSHYNGYFNWSMTYRRDADVPVPYGRTVPLPKDKYLEEVEDVYSQKNKTIAILGSNCGGINDRYKYIKELQQFINVDIYGKCGPLKCPGHFNKDCPLLNEYKFYLAFENSNCDDYITEKLWWNALEKKSVPVVMGAPKSAYQQLLPPKSFIYAYDFIGPRQLAYYLGYLLENPAQYNAYHAWRRKYRVVNEHGYFQTPVYHFCRVCEALNYSPRTGTADLEEYFDKNRHCHAARWRPDTYKNNKN